MSISVLVIGGTGVFGRLIVSRLLTSPVAFHVTVGCRHPEALARTAPELAAKTNSLYVDLSDADGLKRAAAKHDIVVVAAGPFQGLSANIADTIIQAGAHYIDLCDDPVFLRDIIAKAPLWQGSGRIALTALSSLSGVSLPLAALIAADCCTIQDIRVGLFIGNANRKGHGAVFSALDGLNTTATIYKNGAAKNIPGWSERMGYDYPAPIGMIPSYALPSPDAILFAQRYKFESFAAGVGFEWAAARLAFHFFRAATTYGGHKWVKKFVKTFFPVFELFHITGTKRGCVSVTLKGTRSAQPITRRASLVAEHDGQLMAALPTVIACEALARGDITRDGLLLPDEWMDPAAFLRQMASCGMTLLTEELTP